MLRPAVLAAAAIILLPTAALAGSGELQVPDLGRLAHLASEHTQVSIGPGLFGILRHLPASDMSPEDRAVLGAIRSVNVQSFEFTGAHAWRPEDVAGVRAQMQSTGWTRIVQSHSDAEDQDVEIAVALEHDEPTGVAILVTSPHKLAVVNVVGHIPLAVLSRVGGSIGVPAPAVAALHGKGEQRDE